MEKIVILDGHTINPGDLSWEVILQQGECTVYERTPKELVAERCRDAKAVLTSKAIFTREVMESLPKLSYIGVLATGYNVVDVQAARERGITVTNIPAYSTQSVAQMVFALLLQLCCHVKEHSDSVKSGAWSACEDFCYWNSPMIELAGKTLGIVGFGMIGQQTARVANALGMKVAAFGRQRKQVDGIDYQWIDSLDELLVRSDVISLHCPLTEDTNGMINAERLRLMKPSAFLINTARGPLIEENALADALNSKRIAGAALDVLGAEPPAADNPLFRAKNCIITPHIAWATKEARTRLINTAGENLKAYLEGSPVNIVQ